jgi:hypothetical protein
VVLCWPPVAAAAKRIADFAELSILSGETEEYLPEGVARKLVEIGKKAEKLAAQAEKILADSLGYT